MSPSPLSGLRGLLAGVGLVLAGFLSGCSSVDLGGGTRGVILGGVAPGADVTKEVARGR